MALRNRYRPETQTPLKVVHMHVVGFFSIAHVFGDNMMYTYLLMQCHIIYHISSVPFLSLSQNMEGDIYV